MAKQSRALGQVLGGHWKSTGQNFDFFFFNFSKFLKFSDSFIFFNFSKIFGNEIFIPINLKIFKAPPVQF